MAYNLCCDSYHVPNLIYIYYTTVIILGLSVWRVLFLGVVRWLGFWLLRLLWLYWFCLLVFRWKGWGWGGVPVHLFFVVCYCFLFWIGYVSSNSAIMNTAYCLQSKQIHSVTAYCLRSEQMHTLHVFFLSLKDQLDRSCEKWRSVTESQGTEEYPTWNKETEG